MRKTRQTFDVAIVGGGPVGLLLGCRLHALGISFTVLEKRKKPITHSRSLGIHPVSLELFEKLGCAGPFLDQGIRIKRGLAFSDHKQLGEISFRSCPGPYNYILSVPQYKTEALLEKHLHSLQPGALQRGTEVTHLDSHSGENTTMLQCRQNGNSKTIHARYVIGCDGKDSLVRRDSGIRLEGHSYPDTYMMGDFSDNTPFGSDAAVYLHSRGLVESFPLGENQRRWVVKTDRYRRQVKKDDLVQTVGRRTGIDLGGQQNSMLSSFGVQKLIARPMVLGNIVLAGDAAHVVSPIGGQGMNLGWLDAWELADVLKQCLASGSPEESNLLLTRYEQDRIRICKKVIRRAELNMRLGRKTAFPAVRNYLIRLMLNTPASKFMARVFTMRGLKRWPF